MKSQKMYTIITMVPASHTDNVIEAMAEAGAGVIGEYTHNAYITHGEGNWFSGENSNPTIGKAGTMSREGEDKVEMVCPIDKLEQVVEACKKAHPYETPNIQAYEIELFVQ
ncbi:MAG TPA: NGG1p interacting factor NIF3 [Candidatus Dojkabacteria bacterium]|nr:NGG1p interacting factor NIF3 [Candidatus Dojkabacteria bacterium]